jgi:F-type H+-transporting ATPase subunit b
MTWRPAPRFLLAILLLTLLSGAACSQQQPVPRKHKSEPQKAEQAAQPGSEAKVGPEEELEEASREAAGEDATAEFKQSATVRWLAHATGLSPLSAYWVFVALNFAIIVVLLALITKSKVPAAFRARTESIQKQLAEARKASEEAQRRLADIESRLTKLDTEITAMASAAEAEAQKEAGRIQAAAEEDKRKIVEAAEQEIVAAARLARTQLRAYVSELAVALAEKRIQVNASTDKELVRAFVDQLGKDGK